jgi:hypothetical protein
LVINSSHFLLDATPQPAINFCNLSSMNYLLFIGIILLF